MDVVLGAGAEGFNGEGQGALDASVGGVEVDVRGKGVGQAEVDAAVGTLDRGGLGEAGTFVEGDAHPAVGAMQLKRGEAARNFEVAVGGFGFEGSGGAADGDAAVGTMKAQVAGNVFKRLAAVAGGGGDVAAEVVEGDAAVGGVGLEGEIGGCFDLDADIRGTMPVDVEAEVRLFLEREANGVAGLRLFEGVERKLGVLGGDADVDGGARVGARVNVKRAVADFEIEGGPAVERVGFLPRRVGVLGNGREREKQSEGGGAEEGGEAHGRWYASGDRPVPLGTMPFFVSLCPGEACGLIARLIAHYWRGRSRVICPVPTCAVKVRAPAPFRLKERKKPPCCSSSLVRPRPGASTSPIRTEALTVR